MAKCPQSIVIPELLDDACNGKQISSKCVIHEEPVTLLELPDNSTLETILNTYMVSLSTALTRIVALETLTANLEERIIELENP